MDKQKLLVKYFNGECSPHEVKYLMDQLQNEKVEDYDEVMRKLWEDFMVFPALEETTDEKIYRNIQNKANISVLKNTGTVYRRRYFYSIAASIVALLLSSLFIFFYSSSDVIEHQTAYGEKDIIVLPDSSVVTLNANSTLKYNKDSFEGTSREVWISGEAYFDVKRKSAGGKNLQFIVHSDEITIEVLGTRFNVNARNKITEVVLESGKVKLNIEDKSKTLIMKPGDLVAWSNEDKRLERKRVEPVNYSGWRNNKLIHHDGVTVIEIARTIKDSFGFDVVVEDPDIQKKVYKGVFPADNIDVLLQSLSKSFDLKVRKEGDKIILMNNPPVPKGAGINK